MPDNIGAYQEWFAKANEDEKSIQAILKERASPSTVCFLAQQMAEKYLKGLLVLHGKAFRKVHDLLELETALLEVLPAIRDVHTDLTLLNRYYIETRYPGNYPVFTHSDAEEAFTAASRVQEFAKKKVQQK